MNDADGCLGVEFRLTQRVFEGPDEGVDRLRKIEAITEVVRLVNGVRRAGRVFVRTEREQQNLCWQMRVRVKSSMLLMIVERLVIFSAVR